MSEDSELFAFPLSYLEPPDNIGSFSQANYINAAYLHNAEVGQHLLKAFDALLQSRQKLGYAINLGEGGVLQQVKGRSLWSDVFLNAIKQFEVQGLYSFLATTSEHEFKEASAEWLLESLAVGLLYSSRRFDAM